MFKWLFNWLFRRHLDFALNETKTVYVQKVRFVIRKLNPLDHLNGSKILLQYYDTYKSGKEDPGLAELHVKKLKEHYADAFMSAVVSPVLVRKPDDPSGIFVESLFKNWDMCEELYTAINEYTYGKKKVKKLA